ncbi:MAG: hypothetical protein NXH75_00445 [Halobacteriovoraceae bacterium]|nr:hypothetical protein [Halobacteriovoraceae bacterium]
MSNSSAFKNITIQSHRGPYQVTFMQGTSFFKKLVTEDHFFVVDKKVYDLYKDLNSILPENRTLLITADEGTKDLTKIPQFIKDLTDKGLKRNHSLVAVGGGITQDITCFISSILFRGINWKFVPTTLLAQADSCIGSKSSINCSGVKNLVGNFTPPRQIFLSLDFLKTLNDEEVQSGIGEIIKVHMVKGIQQYEDIMKNFDLLKNEEVLSKYLYQALLFKKELIEIDEFDQGPRNIMNYGHTFGHAIEKATNHGIPHGIAVAMGMDMANNYSFKNDLTQDKAVKVTGERLKTLYGPYQDIPLKEDLFFEAIRKDKKNVGNNIALIIPKGDTYKLEKTMVPFDENFETFCHYFFKGGF